MIALRAAEISLGGRAVLRDLDFAARPGELVALCGPNGAGKTTLLRALAGLLPAGRKPDPRKLAYLPQGARCAWGLTVSELVMLGRLPHGDAAAGPVNRALAACGVADLRHQRVDRISGGQARRAMLARVLAGEPEALLLDEPTADLDPAAAHEMMALLRNLARQGACVLVVLHAFELAQRYADRVVVVHRGRIVADADPATALPAVAAAFGLPWGVETRPGLLPPEGG